MAESIPWFSFLGFEGAIHACTFVQGHKRDCLATGCDDGMLLLWDICERKVGWQTKCHKGPIHGLQAFQTMNESTYLASWGRDQIFQVWNVTAYVGRPIHDLNTGKVCNALLKEQQQREQKDYSECELKIIIPTLEFTRNIGGINFCRLVSVPVLEPSPKTTERDYPRGACCHILALADSDNESVLLMDTMQWNIRTLETAGNGHVMSIALIRQQQISAMKSNEHKSSESTVKSRTCDTFRNKFMDGFVVFSEDIFSLIAFESGTLQCWSITQPLPSLENSVCTPQMDRNSQPNSISEDSNWFTSLETTKLTELDVCKGCPLVSVNHQDGQIVCSDAESRFRTGNTRLFAVACSDQYIRIYSRKGTPLATLDQHTDSVLSVAHSLELVHVSLALIDEAAPRGGILLASGGKDCIVHLWSLYNESL